MHTKSFTFHRIRRRRPEKDGCYLQHCEWRDLVEIIDGVVGEVVSCDEAVETGGPRRTDKVEIHSAYWVRNASGQNGTKENGEMRRTS